MSKTNGESENYTTIKAAKQENTYLEDVSGDQSLEEPVKTTCHVCGLTARNQEELQDHIKNAHRAGKSRPISDQALLNAYIKIHPTKDR